MKIQLTLIAAGLLVAATATAQTPNLKRDPRVVSCAAEISRERATFDNTLKKGIADGKIDAKEKADLDKTHAELMAMEKKANEDGKITPDECKGIQAKIVEEGKKLNAALGPRQPGHATKGLPRNPLVVSCSADIARERATFDSSLKKGIADGKIDDKEKADLDKTHAELMAMEKKANEDGKLTPDECKGIHAKIVVEHRKLNAALGDRQPGHATKKPRHPLLVSCSADIARERASFDVTLKKGIADGKIDAKEKADLDKTHAELIALEKKANEDGKLTPDECKGIHAKIVEEGKKLSAALGNRVVKKK